MPFNFRAVSEARGDLLLTVTDELTYYAAGAPKVTNATITLRDPITSSVITNGSSDANGEVLFLNLPEGNYLIEASAPRHALVRGGIRVVPGVTTEQEVFMTRESVRYQWTVVPTLIEDHYRVTLQPLFETEVPQPELVVENPVIAPLVIPGQTSQFEIRLRNTGLIALERVRVPTPNHPKLEIIPLVNEIETLPAQTMIAVPVTIRLRPTTPYGDGPSAGGGGGPGGGGCEGTECVIHMPIDTRYRCGKNFVPKTANVELQVVCVPDTGCEFERVDVTHVDFFNVNARLDRAELDCLMGKLDECQKARIRGYARSGDLGSVDGPFGFGLSDFCGCGPSEKIPTLFNFACQYLESLGFSSPAGCGGPTPPLGFPVNFGTFDFLAATIPGPCNVPAVAGDGRVPPYPSNNGGGIGGDTPPVSNAGGTGVCARVRLEIGQDVTMTRSAFRGTLVIDNDGSALTGIQISLDFRDAANQSVASLFAVSGPTLSGLTAVDGTGIIAAQSSGSAEYLFIPTLNAAPSGPTAYYVGGTLRFIEDGVEIVVPLLPAPITVFPEARLQLDYFLQRDVFSDDPFTLEREPAEPFALGLLVHNTGAGPARNLQIQSGQPRIVENEKGLLIDFALLGVRVGGAPFTPSFNVNFGDINPNHSGLAIWEMTSSLQGKFIEFTGSFEHLDALGGHNLSLIENLNVHEMIHVVRADRPGDDLLSDFLVNDVPDPDNLPDVVYFSDGGTGAVSLATSPVVDAPPTTNDLQVQLTVTMPAGWTYLRMTNPGPQFKLVGVQRSDAKQLALGENVWTTDRSFPSSQAGVVREDLLHLFDHNSTGSYTLTFAVISDDTNGPVSAVAALPATSTTTFAVLWDGDDGANGSGLAYFDIYTSVNGGPFTNWLAQTTLGSAIFTGTPGETYAFYSVATDNAGNVELAPAMADAQTTAATGANTEPTISPIADVTIDEGVKFTLSPTVIDSDVPAQTLNYSLPAAPVGAVIEPTSGFIQWQTGEAQGGSTNLFILVVSDNGLPSLSSTQSFHVIVREVNNAPFFVSPVAEVEVDEGTMLAYTAAASDADVPPNQLAWSLGAGAPAGMTLNAANGLLNWMLAESDGPGEFPVTITVSDNGSPAQNVTRILRVVVREVNQPPELATIPTQGTLVQTTLYVTNSATDSDLPAQEFYFSLAPGAPKGASIRPDTGLFSWTPSSAYALSTNQVTVQVTDNGLPSLTASRTFTIVVGDYLEARLGRVVAPSGGSNSIPVAVFTTVPVTNVAFIFEPMVHRLSNFNLSAAAPPLASATLSPLGGNQYQVQLAALPGQSMSGEQAMVDLRFDAPAGQPSAFVPLVASSVVATQVDGQPVPKAAGSPGRVVYLDQESLLELVPQSNHMDLVLYGRAPEYVIQSTPGLPPLGAWTRLRDGSPTNYVLSFPVITTNHMGFFRAVEGGPFRFSAIEVNPLSGEVTLNLSVLPGLTYELQWTTNTALWNSFFTNTATSNALIVTDQPPAVSDRRLYRAIER